MNQESAKARLERYIREINAAQSKAIVLKNDLFNDYELEDFENDYINTLWNDDNCVKEFEDYVDKRYFTKLCDDIDDVIEANNQLLAHLYAAKRSYMSVSVRTRRGGFSF